MSCHPPTSERVTTLIQGTRWNVQVEAPREDVPYDGVHRCIWCGEEFDYEDRGDWRCVEAMYDTADGSYNWDGEYVHGVCDSERLEATQQVCERRRRKRQKRKRQKRACQEEPVSPRACQEEPVSPRACQEEPVSPRACQEEPVSPRAC